MRVLFIAHGFPPASTGGTEIYAHDLARVLRDRFADEVFVLAREADPARPEYGLRRERRDGLEIAWINNTFRAARGFADGYRNPRIRRTAASFIDEAPPDVAHIHHLTCLSTELIDELVTRRIPVVLTLNDYWMACHRGQLLDVDYQRCAGPSVDACARCIGESVGPRGSGWAAPLARTLQRVVPPTLGRRLDLWARVAASSMGGQAAARRAAAERLDHMRGLLGRVDRILTPSRTLRARFLDFGAPADRVLLQEQGIDQDRLRATQRVPGDRLRVGFLGSLMISKAPHVLLEAAGMLPEDAVSVHLYGAIVPYHGDDSYRARLSPLLARPNVQLVGPVPHEQIARALASIDVLVVPSIWIENAPFVIREAFAAGVPVVASDLGGMAELVAHEQSGLLFEPGRADDLCRTLRRLLDEPGLLDRLRRGVPRMVKMEEDAAWTREIYASHLPAAKRALVSIRREPGVSPASRLAAVILNYRTAEDTELAARALLGSRRPVDDLILVDNGSADGSEARLRAQVPQARVLQTGRNLGFAAGCNAGIRAALEAGAELVALVNSDVILPPDALTRLERALQERPDLGMAGPLILSRSHPTRVASCGMTYSPVSGRMRHRETGCDMAELSMPPLVEVDGLSGCVLLVRREVFERVGLLTEDYFFSFEDLDFCLRARERGFASACVTDALAYHEGGATIGCHSARRVYFATRNHLALAARVGPRSPAPLRALSILSLNLAYVLVSGEVPRVGGLLAFARGAIDHFAGHYGSGPTSEA